MLDSDYQDLDRLHPADQSGPPTPVTCPDCGGAIWISGPAQPLRFQCHVGHQYSEQGFAQAKQEELEMALWTALRALKENAALYGTMVERALSNGRTTAAQQFEQTQQEVERKIQIVKQALHRSATSQ